jgi:hypothetical protein
LWEDDERGGERELELLSDSLSKKKGRTAVTVLFDIKTQCVGDEYGQEPKKRKSKEHQTVLCSVLFVFLFVCSTTIGIRQSL